MGLNFSKLSFKVASVYRNLRNCYDNIALIMARLHDLINGVCVAITRSLCERNQ